METPTTFESVLLAELNLGLPPLTFYRIGEEPSDWSFVLKLHAVMECALNRLLDKRLPEDEFEETMTCARKIQLAFEMPEFAHDEHYRSFLITLNYLRNRFAHRAKYIVADLGKVLQEVPSHRRSSVLQSLAVGFKIPGTAEHDSRNRQCRERIMLECPRFTIHTSASYALVMLSLAYYFHLGKDGKIYVEEYRHQLQDLLHDPEVIEFRRKLKSEFEGEGGSPTEGV
jgi:hypothetical protein